MECHVPDVVGSLPHCLLVSEEEEMKHIRNQKLQTHFRMSRTEAVRRHGYSKILNSNVIKSVA